MARRVLATPCARAAVIPIALALIVSAITIALFCAVDTDLFEDIFDAGDDIVSLLQTGIGSNIQMQRLVKAKQTGSSIKGNPSEDFLFNAVGALDVTSLLQTMTGLDIQKRKLYSQDGMGPEPPLLNIPDPVDYLPQPLKVVDIGTANELASSALYGAHHLGVPTASDGHVPTASIGVPISPLARPPVQLDRTVVIDTEFSSSEDASWNEYSPMDWTAAPPLPTGAVNPYSTMPANPYTAGAVNPYATLPGAINPTAFNPFGFNPYAFTPPPVAAAPYSASAINPHATQAGANPYASMTPPPNPNVQRAWTAPPIANQAWTAPPIVNQAWTAPPVATAQYAPPPVATAAYPAPPIATASYTPPPVATAVYTLPPAATAIYTPPPVATRDYTPPPHPAMSDWSKGAWNQYRDKDWNDIPNAYKQPTARSYQPSQATGNYDPSQQRWYRRTSPIKNYAQNQDRGRWTQYRDKDWRIGDRRNGNFKKYETFGKWDAPFGKGKYCCTGRTGVGWEAAPGKGYYKWSPPPEMRSGKGGRTGKR